MPAVRGRPASALMLMLWVVPQVSYVLLVSRQGKVRLAKWFSTLPAKQKGKVVKDVTQLVLARRTRMCNFLEYKGAYSLCLSPIEIWTQ